MRNKRKRREISKHDRKMKDREPITYWIIHKGFDASDICIMKAAMGCKLVHRAEGTKQTRQSVQFDKTLDERMRLRPQRSLETIHKFGADSHLFGVVFWERQLCYIVAQKTNRKENGWNTRPQSQSWALTVSVNVFLTGSLSRWLRQYLGYGVDFGDVMFRRIRNVRLLTRILL